MEIKMEHEAKSPHVHKLMGGHKNEHSPANILMRKHHYAGGMSGGTPSFKEGGKAKHEERSEHHHGSYSHRTKRKPHAEGGTTNDEREKSSTKPFRSSFRTGGHARHEHHAFGDKIGNLSEHMGKFGEKTKEFGEKIKSGIQKGASETKEFGQRLKHAFKPNSDFRRPETRPRPENRYAGGLSGRAPAFKEGGRSRREHHFMGEVIGGLAIPALTAGIQGISKAVKKGKDNREAASYGKAHGDTTYENMKNEGYNKHKSTRAAAEAGRKIYQGHEQAKENERQQGMMNQAVRNQLYGRMAAGGSGKIRHGVMSANGRPLHPR